MSQIATLLAKGQNAYSEKQYSTSLQRFNDAYAIWKSNGGLNSDVLSIFDLRIATHVKMNNLKLAHEDAKSMIRIDRADGRGYLRCGQIERLQGNSTAALKWYDHGLKNVPEVDKMFTYLQAQRQKIETFVTSQKILSRAADPIARLPSEIVQMIVAYLDFQQIVGCLRVSRTWTRILINLKPLTDTVDLEKAKRRLNTPMMRACIRRLSVSPKAVTVDNLSNSAANLLYSRLERWDAFQTLQTLKILDCELHMTSLPFSKYDLREVTFGSYAPVQVGLVQQILQACDKLKSAAFMKITPPCKSRPRCSFPWEGDIIHLNMKRLFMHFEDVYPVGMPTNFFNSFPNLIDLECSGVDFCPDSGEAKLDLSHVNNLVYLDLSRSRIPQRVLLPQSLQTWICAKSSIFYALRDLSQSPMPFMPNLMKIDVSGSCHGVLSMTGHWSDARTKSVLTHLAIGENETSTNVFFTMISNGSLCSLRFLDLTCQELKDEQLNMFQSNIPNLETLILRNASVTGVFLHGLLEGSKGLLQKITLKDCSRVSPDAIEWAKGTGTKVNVLNDVGLGPSSRRLARVF